MSKSKLQLIGEATYASAPNGNAGENGSQQLSLFDFRPVARLVCLPMSELHGATFGRLLTDLRPRAIVDLRTYPYFDLVALSHRRALEIIRAISSPYYHSPMDLNPPADQSARWQLRQTAFSALSSLPQAIATSGGTLVFFVNNQREIEVLTQAVRHSDGGSGIVWKVEPATQTSIYS